MINILNKNKKYDGSENSEYRAGSLFAPKELFLKPLLEVEAICRERTFSTYVGDNQVLSRILANYKFLTSTSDVGFAPHIIQDGYWEIWLTKWMVENIKPNWTAIDIGANYGYYSILLSDLVGANGQVIAFEPNPIVAEAAEFSIAVNGFTPRCSLNRVALSNDEGECLFFVPAGEPKNGQLIYSDVPNRNGQSYNVSISKLDSYTSELESVDFIKIDAEGAETEIFLGMEQTIKEFNPLILMEFNAARDDAEQLADNIYNTYKNVLCLNTSGEILNVTMNTVMQENYGEDKLLILKK